MSVETEDVKLEYPGVSAEKLEEVREALRVGKTEISIQTESVELLRLVCSIKTLTKLRLFTGEMQSLPPEIGQLENLERLNLEQNSLTSLPEEFGNLRNLRILHIYKNHLESLPETFGNLKSLEECSLWGNQLQALPESIGGLENLSDLDLNDNKIQSLPASLANLKNLKNLELDNNLLTDLPTELAGLDKLKSLSLEENNITHFPDVLTGMSGLSFINLEENELETFPEDMTGLAGLRTLKLGSGGGNANQIKALPESLFELEELETLDLEGNLLEEVSPLFARLKNLTSLNLEENPLKNVPEEVMEQGWESIFTHLGLREEKKISGDLPAPAELKKILADYTEPLNVFVRYVRDRSHNETRFESLMEFLKGKTDVVPPGTVDDHYGFEEICNIMQPHNEWTFIERRILAFVTQDAWLFQDYNKYHNKYYEEGYSEGFFKWLKKSLEQETEGDLFQNIAAELRAFGVEEDVILHKAVDEMDGLFLAADKTPTSLGRYMLDSYEQKLEIMRKATSSAALVELFMLHRGEDFKQYVPEYLKLESAEADKNGRIHVSIGILRLLCELNAAEYESFALEAIKVSNCQSCRAKTARILLNGYGDKHRPMVLEIIKDSLKYISERKNKSEHSYDFDFGVRRFKDDTAAFIEWALENFEQEARPLVFEYVENTKLLDLGVTAAVAKYIGQDGIDIICEALNMQIKDKKIANHYRRLFEILAPLDYSKYHDKVWELVQNEYLEVRQAAAQALGQLGKSVLAPVKELLAHKKGDSRHGGVLVLIALGGAGARKILEQHKDGEKIDDIRDLIVNFMYSGETKITAAELKARVAGAVARGKLAKPLKKWLDAEKLPSLKWAKGKKALELDAVRFLIYRQNRALDIEAEAEVRAVYDLIDKKSSGDFALELLNLVQKNGGVNAKNRFALALIGLLGDERILEDIESAVYQGNNENAVKVLGLQGSARALRMLEEVMRKYTTKYKNVGETARDAFTLAAERQGLSSFELADSLLPDFGFKNLSRELKIGAKKYRAFIDVNRKIVFFDETGKKIKSMPSAAPAPLKNEFKELNKEITENAKAQKAALENYLVIQRRWSKQEWEKHFLKNPLMFAFARNMIWGRYAKGKLLGAFSLNENCTLTDVAGAKVSLGKEESAGAVHPVELKATELKKWAALLQTNKLEPAFPQLERKVVKPAPDAKKKSISFQFDDREVAGGTFKSRADRLGWRRGSVVDSGAVSGYRKEFPNANLEVFIKLENLGVRGDYDYDAKATLREFFFVKAGTVTVGSYVYDEPRNADDPRLVPFGRVPAIVYSEAISDLEKILLKKE